MQDYLVANKKWWDTVTPIHSSSQLYNLEAFKKGKTSLEKTELQELGNVKGKTMLHLLCHFGMDSLSWAREGAIVTGVDLSEASIKLAKKLSREINTPATFICSDIYKLNTVLDKKFDIIFMSYGVLLWLSNLKKWAKIIHYFLKPGGTFYIVELHPFTNMLGVDLNFAYNYFDKGPYEDDAEGTYSDWNSNIQGATYIWLHSMGDVVNALIDAKLHIEFIHEFPFTMYDQFPGYMEKNKKGQYVLKNKEMQIPLLFSLKATK